MKEKTKHHKHNISAGFHPGIDNISAGFHPGIDKEKTKHHKHNISAGFHPGIDNKGLIYYALNMLWTAG